MKIRAYILMAAILTAMFSILSCENLTETDETPGFEVIAAVPGTKTVNDGLNTRWSEGDAVHVYHRVSGSTSYIDDGKFTLKDAASGTFTGVLSSPLDPSASYDWRMVYPFTEGAEVPVGSAWQSQSGNGSTAHLCGVICPLEGTLESVPGSQSPVVRMHNLATVAKVTVVNSSNHPMTVNTVKLRSATLQVQDPGTIAVGDSADFYVVASPFAVSASAPLEVSVDSYKRSFSSDASFAAGSIKKIRFVYDNPDTQVIDRNVWISDRYSSFTDIVYFGKKYYVAFREAGGHVAQTFADRGSIFILSSDDCVSWTKEVTITRDFDLRDPHFIVSDDGARLFVYYGRAIPGAGDDGYFPAPYCTEVSILQLDAAGKLTLKESHDVDMGADSRYWLWGMAKHKGTIYGVGYYIINKDAGTGYPVFMKSTDGINFTRTANIFVEGNEAHPCFVGDRVYVFFRSVESNDGYVTYSEGPNYTRWRPKPQLTYEELKMHCPTTLYLWDKVFVCMKSNTYALPIYAFNPENNDFRYLHTVFDVQTDFGYPGMIVHDDCLHVVYYAYKLGKQNIFYQRIPLSKLYTLTESAFK